MAIAESVIEEIRSRVSIVEVASEFCDVKRSGNKHLACCPFHQEKTPSCSFNEEEGFFYCFGCGKKGNVYTLLMELRGLSFPDAVRNLGERVGIAVQDDYARNKRSSDEVNEKVVLREVVATAARAYILALRNDEFGDSAREYFSSRGLSELTQKKYCLGYAPGQWNFIEERCRSILEKGKFSGKLEDLPRYLSSLGLIKQRNNDSGEGENTHYDAFRDRVIFPILRNDNTPIAFGARLLVADSKAPKYLNSSESILYQKRKTLYGLGPALNDIRSRRHLYLVEGYMDVLSMVEAGVPNVLATCGTAVSEDHARAISRVADRVTLLFDGDVAGRKAAARCFEAFLNTGVDVSVRMLPDGEDPDTIAQSYANSGTDTGSRSSSEATLNEYLNKKQTPVLSLFLRQMRAEVVGDEGSSSAALMGKVAQRCAQTFARVRNPVERELYEQEAAGFLGISAQSLASIVREQQKSQQRSEQQAGFRSSYKRSAGPRYNSGSSFTASTSGLDASAEDMPPLDSYELGVPVEAQEPEIETKPRLSRSDERFHHELIVAILSEPLLAPTALELPSLISADSNGEGSGLPRNILDFVEHVAAKGLPLQTPDECMTEEGRAKLENLLKEFSIEPRGILEDLLRQIDVGGGNPSRVLSQAGQIALRQGLINEMVRIRGREESSGRDDAEERLKLAQSKLEKRKALEQMSKENKD